MEPEKIKTLLAVPEDQLDQAARKLHLPLPVASAIRLQAMNLVLGKCCLCGRQTQMGVCRSCSKNPVAARVVPWTGQELLQQLDPSAQLIQRTCVSCRRSFMLSASSLLQQLQSQDPKPRKVCRQCFEKAGAEEEKAPEQAVPEQNSAPSPDQGPVSEDEKARLERVARIEREKARVAKQRTKKTAPAPRPKKPAEPPFNQPFAEALKPKAQGPAEPVAEKTDAADHP